MRRLVTFLGLGPYQCANFYWPAEGEAETIHSCYVCRVLAERWQAEEIIVLATKAAWTWHERALVQEFQQAKLPQPRHKSIPDGSQADQLWEQFVVIREQLRASDQDDGSQDWACPVLVDGQGLGRARGRLRVPVRSPVRRRRASGSPAPSVAAAGCRSSRRG